MLDDWWCARGAGIKFDFERIFSQTVSGAPKTEACSPHPYRPYPPYPPPTHTHTPLEPRQVLAKLAAGAPASARLIFVEDKYSTLEKVAKAPGFEIWELYLGAPQCNRPVHPTPASAPGLQCVRWACVGPIVTQQPVWWVMCS